mgnify:CR=1 FL=1
MSQQSSGMTASVTSLSPEPESHHNKPEEHKEKETFNEDISLEEALSTL